MAGSTEQSPSALAWRLARHQHWVVSRAQLLGLGFTPGAIEHRLATGRLRPLARGVYAVGRREIGPLGRWRGALLSCADRAVLSHSSAAALFGIATERLGVIEVSVRAASARRRPGLRVHRRPTLGDDDVGEFERIPVTSPEQTIVDLAPRLGGRLLTRAINEADKRGLLDPEALRAGLERRRGTRGVPRLTRLLDRLTFRFTNNDLEAAFLPIAAAAGLPPPLTSQWLNEYEVDFYWPQLGLVVETDGLRYHRTPAAQARDRERDQDHTAAGLTQLRFTHGQVRYEPERVLAILVPVARRLLASKQAGQGGA